MGIASTPRPAKIAKPEPPKVEVKPVVIEPVVPDTGIVRIYRSTTQSSVTVRR
jgi:hypothetical protein